MATSRSRRTKNGATKKVEATSAKRSTASTAAKKRPAKKTASKTRTVKSSKERASTIHLASRNISTRNFRGKSSLIYEYFPNLIKPNTEEEKNWYRDLREESTLKTTERCRNIITEFVIEAKTEPDSRVGFAIEQSGKLLPGYATLDQPHCDEIQRLIKQISDYLSDSTRKRPFNALMLAAPGAGKTHFINCLAKSMEDKRVEAVTFNMATMQSADDMAQPIDELRNLKVNDRFSLLFLDEFDSDPSRYASLLPLLWDGELLVGNRALKLGKAVIVLAGSSPDLPKVMDHAAAMRPDAEFPTDFGQSGKLVDLLSRINGGDINIPDLDLQTDLRDRRVDKVCITAELIKARFGATLKSVPRSLFRFISHTTFRYGVRSIAHLIDIISPEAVEGETLKFEKFGLPLSKQEELENSSLRLHLLDRNESYGIVKRWNEFAEDGVDIDLPSGTFFLSSAMFEFLSETTKQN